MLSLKTRFKIILSVFVVILLTGSFILYSRDNPPVDKDQILIKVLMQGLASGHYEPEKIDDAFSQKVFDLYLDRLDFNKKFLLASDVQNLRKYSTAIDDQLREGSLEFFEASSDLLDQRMKESASYYKEILS